jgi:hypothetical protein
MLIYRGLQSIVGYSEIPRDRTFLKAPVLLNPRLAGHNGINLIILEYHLTVAKYRSISRHRTGSSERLRPRAVLL